MKRYVAEFARDMQRRYPNKMKCIPQKIETVLFRYDHGYITELDAVKAIIAICEEE